MFTENWPLTHDPQLPARWVLGDSPRPIVAYLDQWCYDHLARDRAGSPMEASEAGTFQILRDMALAGKVIFALSEAHYRENWQRDNADGRWDTAVAMAELTGFHTLRTKNLDVWDASVGAVEFLGLPVTLEKPEPLGWGLKHCLTGVHGQAFILDKATGAPALWDTSLPAELRAQLEELEANVPYRLELGVLALRDPRMEPVFAPQVSIADGKGAQFAALEVSIRAAIDQQGRTSKAVRNAIEYLAFTDSIKLFDPVLRALGKDPNTVVTAIADGVVNGENPAMHRLLDAMPIQGAFTELRVQTHLQADRKPKNSDLLDFFALATALPFVDYFVSDRKTFNLATSAKLNSRGGGKVIPTLRDLCDELLALA
ncbi:hypothetical protein [Catelliglobosispora koreensis]|uniref:hypothetical protein n=1 Tax=Catelliglobosispora koreensis TaxID=129052 RepID=UPI00037ABEB4|nr:hypothetical protein [Catelliglobosispora koreensis]